jgi:hypothetical protein
MEPSPQSPYTKQSSGLRPRPSFWAFALDLRRETFPGRAFVQRPSPGAFSGRAFAESLLLPASAGSLLPPASSGSLLPPAFVGSLLLPAFSYRPPPRAFSRRPSPEAFSRRPLPGAFSRRPSPRSVQLSTLFGMLVPTYCFLSLQRMGMFC